MYHRVLLIFDRKVRFKYLGLLCGYPGYRIDLQLTRKKIDRGVPLMLMFPIFIIATFVKAPILGKMINLSEK